MKVIYYIETNLICLALIFIGFSHIRSKDNLFSPSKNILSALAVATSVLCLSDMAAIMVRGEMFTGARIIVELSNMIYLESVICISLIWCIYVMHKTDTRLSRKGKILFWMPFTVMTLVLLTNPFTHFIFSVDANNLYSRAYGVFVHWILSWSYCIYATFISVIKYKKATTTAERDELRPLNIFIIAPFIGGTIQMTVYGVTSIQVGVTLSIIMIIIKLQDNMILTDELTGLNNRKAFSYYIENLVSNSKNEEIFILMIDINNFKAINDKLGHHIGDFALKDVADVLRKICNKYTYQMFLCRYGGDEFVFAGKNVTDQQLNLMCEDIRCQMTGMAAELNRPYELEISTGIAKGTCENMMDFQHYLRVADEAMYEDKKIQKAEKTLN